VKITLSIFVLFFFSLLVSKKNVDGRSTSSHDNKKFRTSSMEKQGGMAFGLWEMATAVIEPNRQILYPCNFNHYAVNINCGYG
jgi:hypothetical protein